MKKKNIFSFIIASLLSVSILSFNCSAFTFDGENRSLTDIYSDWFLSTRDYVTGNSTFEQWRNDNIRFQTDILGSNLFPGSDSELQSYINDIEQNLRTAAEGTDNKVDDTFLDIFGSAVETIGIFNFRDQFEQWYQDKYGKEYGKHENPLGSQFEPGNARYYMYCRNPSGTREYKWFMNIRKSSIKTYLDGGTYWFKGDYIDEFDYIQYSRYESAAGWTEWTTTGWYYNQYIGGTYYLYNNGGDYVVTDTNLPFDFGNGEPVVDNPVTDWDNEFGDNLVAPTITLPEIGDLLTDLDNDLKNTDTDTDNPNKGVEIKITQLTNKLHNDLSKVIEYLKKILEKITDFFDNFFDRLGDFFQSVFVPHDDYFNNVIMDIKAEFDDAFSFAGDLCLIVDSCISAYKSGGTRPPEINVDIDGYGLSHKLDFSVFDGCIDLIRSVICAFCYASFALSTYRRIPLYISGGGDK